MVKLNVLALAATLSAASAQVIQGFNYGATNTDNSVKTQADFQREFTAAQNLPNASGFSSARLFTMIQGGSTNSPIEAIPAAISTKTSLLLGMWASGGQTGIDNEIAALKNAVQQYGSAFTDLVVGLSVGSEDLYRITPTGVMNNAGIGAGPDTLSSYIRQVRDNLPGALNNVQIGHVDTWTVYVNGSNKALIDAVDWIGMDAYPYFQPTMPNGIDNAAKLFQQALTETRAAVGGKPVWVTESGWPVSGDVSGQAIASVQNAKKYWDSVACELFGTVNTWWYILQDDVPTAPNPSFGITDANLKPLFDLSCTNTGGSGFSSSSSSSSSSSHSALKPTSSSSGKPMMSDSSATRVVHIPVASHHAGGMSGSSASQSAPAMSGSMAPQATPGTAGSASAAAPAGVSPSASTPAGATYTGAASQNIIGGAVVLAAGIAVALF